MSLAVYTTVYPGVEAYLADWYRSLRGQTDQNFELWIGLDALDSQLVESRLGGPVKANWVTAQPGATPAQIRQKALAAIVETCCAVVLVDSDDVLHASRVAAARTALQASDLAGCALRLIDEKGNDLGLTFGQSAHREPNAVFPRNNVFGFSNSAFSCNLLRRCLPIPADTVAVDWLLASRAWLLGARLAFDPVPRMDYRQHPANTARLRFPMGPNQVVSDTELVRRHFQVLLGEPGCGFLPHRKAALRAIAAEIEEFYRRIVLQPNRLDTYVEALNTLRPAPLWWSCVGHPALMHMWTTTN